MVDSRKFITVRIVCADSHQPFDQTLELPQDTCVIEALKVSRLTTQFSKIDLMQLAVGVFGQKVGLDYRLTDGNRIEILQPLKISPLAARHQRHAQSKS